MDCKENLDVNTSSTALGFTLWKPVIDEDDVRDIVFDEIIKKIGGIAEDLNLVGVNIKVGYNEESSNVYMAIKESITPVNIEGETNLFRLENPNEIIVYKGWIKVLTFLPEVLIRKFTELVLLHEMRHVYQQVHEPAICVNSILDKAANPGRDHFDYEDEKDAMRYTISKVDVEIYLLFLLLRQYQSKDKSAFINMVTQMLIFNKPYYKKLFGHDPVC